MSRLQAFLKRLLACLTQSLDAGPVEEKWVLPMSFRSYNPWGWKHGEVNDKGQLHPGYDLNDGPSALADMGLPIYAPRSGKVVFAKRTNGWGTLLVVEIEGLVDGRKLAYRIGHPKDIYVQWGERVQAGQLIATCGDGYLPERYTPHLHYDIVDVERLAALTGTPPAWQYYDHGADVKLFEVLYRDPRDFHPEIDRKLRENEPSS